MTQTTYDGGRKYPLHWELITTKRWSLSWHPHTKACRYGWYHNRTLTGGGLWMQLNIPILGDFGLWQHWQPSASVPNGQAEASGARGRPIANPDAPAALPPAHG